MRPHAELWLVEAIIRGAGEDVRAEAQVGDRLELPGRVGAVEPVAVLGEQAGHGPPVGPERLF
jgi:hypothetical protein